MIPGIVAGQRSPAQIIKNLFAQGQQGFWLPFTDFASLLQDSAGTLPYTALGQPVGRVLDRSGRGNHAIQPTSTARGAVSARVNQYLETENIVGSKWTKLNSTAAVATSPFVGAGVTKITSAVSTAVTGFGFFAALSGVQRWELSAKAVDGGRYLAFVINQYKEYCFTFDLQTGTITQSPTLGAATAQITAGVDGFWDIVVFQTGNNVLPRWLLSDTPTLNNNTTTFVGDGVKAILVAKPQASMVLEANRYQRVNTSTDYDSVGFPKYLRLDGVDDFYTCSGGGSTTGFYYSDVIRPSGTGLRPFFSDRNFGAKGFEAFVTAANKVSLIGGNGSAYSGPTSTDSAPNGTFTHVAVWDDQTNLCIQINGGAVVTAARPAIVGGAAAVKLGKPLENTNYFNGQITEPIYRAGPLPSAYERGVIRAYQMQKAGML